MRQTKERKLIFPSWNIREEPDSVKQPPVSQTALVLSVLKLNTASTIHEINWKVRSVNLNDSLTRWLQLKFVFMFLALKCVENPDVSGLL